MSKVDNATILQTIKEDNLVLFSAYIEGKESLAFLSAAHLSSIS